jgi:hypothetical protein
MAWRFEGLWLVCHPIEASFQHPADGSKTRKLKQLIHLVSSLRLSLAIPLLKDDTHASVQKQQQV